MHPNVNSINNTSNNNTNNNNNNPFSPFISKAKSIWASITIFVKIIIILTLFLYLVNLFFPFICFYLVNIPYKTLTSFQLWRLITTVLITTSILNVTFAFLIWVPDAIRLEQTSGTLRYMLNFMINSILIQIIHCLLAVLLSPIFGWQMKEAGDNSGLWPLIIAEVTLLCLANPDILMMLFYIPYKFKARYYPYIILLLFTLLNGIQIDIVAGVIYAYLYFYFLRERLQFSNEFVMKMENFFPFKHCQILPGFVSVQNTMTIPFGTQPQTTENIEGNQFQGKGTTVGGKHFL